MTPEPILTAAETRAAEDRAIAAGSSIEALMERAGAAVAEAAWRYGGGSQVLILCGPGNNGGDGHVAARLLAARGAEVRVAACAEPATAAARAARAGWRGAVAPLGEARPAAVLVDALFGTGLSRPLAAEVAEPLHRLAAAARFRLAVDLPSGVATDDGADLGAARCDLTLALGARKPAHLLQPAAALCGQVRVADIGLAPASDLATLGRPVLPPPGPADHKYSRGQVAVVGGAMPGAGLLAAEAAQRAGAGYVALFGGRTPPAAPHALVRRGLSADALADPRIGAIVIGPGLGRDAAARARLDAALAAGRPLVIDADALGLLDGRRPPRAILTPHEGEFVRLFGALPGGKVARARAAAERSGAVVLLKGADTVIAAPDGRAVIGAGPPWLASAGTGDVLAGIAGAMLARGLDPFAAARAALWLHGEAARRAGPGLIADDLARHLPAALARAAR